MNNTINMLLEIAIFIFKSKCMMEAEAVLELYMKMIMLFPKDTNIKGMLAIT